jgi:hypothetical protein
MEGSPRTGVIRTSLSLADLAFCCGEAKAALEAAINRRRARSYSTRPHRAEILVFSPSIAVEKIHAASPVKIELDWGLD